MKSKRFAFAISVACAAFLASSLAHACSLSLTEYSPLAHDRVTLSGETLAKVAGRVIDARYAFDGQWQIVVVGHAMPDEANAEELAERRKAYAISVLQTVLHIAPERFTVSGSEVYSRSSLHYARGSQDDYPAIEIMVSPVCTTDACHVCNSEPPSNS